MYKIEKAYWRRNKKIWTSKKFKISIAAIFVFNILFFVLFDFVNGQLASCQPYKSLEKDFLHMSMESKTDKIQEQFKQFEAFMHIESVLRREAQSQEIYTTGRNKFKDDFDKYFDLYRSGEWVSLMYCNSTNAEYAFWLKIKSELEIIVNCQNFILDIQKSRASAWHITL